MSGASAVPVPAYRLQLQRTGSVISDARFCAGAHDVIELARRLIGDSDREHLVAIYLDAQRRFVGVHVVAIGGVAGLEVTAGEVFKAGLLCNAAAVVLAHNHPSGEPAPSPQDIRFTEQLEIAGVLIGIHVLDHLILGSPGAVSLYESNRMALPGNWEVLGLAEYLDSAAERVWDRRGRPGRVHGRRGYPAPHDRSVEAAHGSVEAP